MFSLPEARWFEAQCVQSMKYSAKGEALDAFCLAPLPVQHLYESLLRNREDCPTILPASFGESDIHRWSPTWRSDDVDISIHNLDSEVRYYLHSVPLLHWFWWCLGYRSDAAIAFQNGLELLHQRTTSSFNYHWDGVWNQLCPPTLWALQRSSESFEGFMSNMLMPFEKALVRDDFPRTLTRLDQLNRLWLARKRLNSSHTFFVDFDFLEQLDPNWIVARYNAAVIKSMQGISCADLINGGSSEEKELLAQYQELQDNSIDMILLEESRGEQVVQAAAQGFLLSRNYHSLSATLNGMGQLKVATQMSLTRFGSIVAIDTLEKEMTPHLPDICALRATLNDHKTEGMTKRNYIALFLWNVAGYSGATSSGEANNTEALSSNFAKELPEAYTCAADDCTSSNDYASMTYHFPRPTRQWLRNLLRPGHKLAKRRFEGVHNASGSAPNSARPSLS